MMQWVRRSAEVRSCRLSKRPGLFHCERARLPQDDVYIALKDVIPHLSRSSLHHCLQRNDISRLPKSDRENPKRFKSYENGYFHTDIAELRYGAARLSSSSQSIARRRSSSPEPVARQQSLGRPASSRLWSRQYPTKSTQFPPITASNSCNMTDGPNVVSSITSSAPCAHLMR